MANLNRVYLLAVFALTAALLSGGLFISTLNPTEVVDRSTSTCDVQNSGQSDYSTSSNNGGLVWKFESGKSGENFADNWFFRRPLVTGTNNTVIFEAGGSMYGVRNGALVWQYQVTDEQSPIWRTMSPPCIGPDGNIFVGGYDKHLHALDGNGKLLWKYDAGYYIHSTPALGPDGTIYFGTTVNGWDENESLHYYLHAVNPDGTLKWKVETGPCSESAVVTSEDGTIYMVSGASTIRWDQKPRYLYSIDRSGSVNWIHGLGNNSYLSPTIGDDGIVYLLTDDVLDLTGDKSFNLLAIRPDGSEAWRLDVRTACPYYTGVHGTPPVVAADGTIYFGKCDGIAAVDKNGTFKWTFTIDRGLASTPVISREGTIIFGSIGHDDPDKGNYGYVFALNPDGTLKWKVKTFDYPLSNAALGEDGTVYVAANGNVFAINGGISPEVVMLVTVLAVGMVAVMVIATFFLIRKRSNRKP